MGRTGYAIALVGAVALAASSAAPRAGERHEYDRFRRGCSEATLRGAYGIQWVGSRPARVPPNTPPVLETFTGIAIRTFDGEGNFTQVSNVKGAVTGIEPENIESVGTYQVNEDCSGTTSSQFVPGGPIVVTRFVIVDNGDEVLSSVMEPLAIINAGVMRRIHTR